MGGSILIWYNGAGGKIAILIFFSSWITISFWYLSSEISAFCNIFWASFTWTWKILFSPFFSLLHSLSGQCTSAVTWQHFAPASFWEAKLLLSQTLTSWQSGWSKHSPRCKPCCSTQVASWRSLGFSLSPLHGQLLGSQYFTSRKNEGGGGEEVYPAVPSSLVSSQHKATEAVFPWPFYQFPPSLTGREYCSMVLWKELCPLCVTIP